MDKAIKASAAVAEYAMTESAQNLVNSFILWASLIAIIWMIIVRVALPMYRTTGCWAFLGGILIAMGICNSWLFVLAGYKSTPQTVSAILSLALAAIGLRFFGNWLSETPQPVERTTEKERKLEKFLAEK